MTVSNERLLKYAQLQMAAEAIFPEEIDFSNPADVRVALQNGNFRASRFTPVGAEEFTSGWSIIDHKLHSFPPPSKSSGLISKLYRGDNYSDAGG